MELRLVLSAISAGGVVGVADQYLCLLLVSVAANRELFRLAEPVQFMEKPWFIGIVLFFWMLTVLPQYLALVAPGIGNTIATIINFLSGFVVPASAGLLALSAAGIIVDMRPEFEGALKTLNLFDPDGSFGRLQPVLAVFGGGALAATSLTAMKGLAKPAVSTATGMTGTLSAPAYATVENLASLFVMGLSYLLAKIDPRLMILLLALVILFVVALFTFAVYQLRRLKKGIGRVFYLLQTNPKAGLAIVAEFLVWGSGWLIWRVWARGAVMLVIWLGFLLGFFGLLPLALASVIFSIPYLVFSGIVFSMIGMSSSRGLMRMVDSKEQVTPGELQPATGSS